MPSYQSTSDDDVFDAYRLPLEFYHFRPDYFFQIKYYFEHPRILVAFFS